jgi:hypothetical protein
MDSVPENRHLWFPLSDRKYHFVHRSTRSTISMGTECLVQPRSAVRESACVQFYLNQVLDNFNSHRAKFRDKPFKSSRLQHMSESYLLLELIILILESSFYISDGEFDRKKLQLCAGIWYQPTQQLLFRSIRFHRSARPLPSVRKVFYDSSRGRVLRTYVRCLSMSAVLSTM